MQQYKGEQTAVMTDFYGGRLSRANSSEDLKHENSSSASGFKPDKTANLESVNDLIHDPICAGFLFKHCEAHYCSENIRFVIEVDKYRDFFLTETLCWHKSWKEIDRELDIGNGSVDRTNTKDRATEIQELLDESNLTSEDLWPSRKIARSAVESMAKQIWETFLSDRAEYQICVPSSVLWNTMRRMRHIHLYGREVFHEALNEPIKTIFRDIYPRFRNSEQMIILRQRMREVEDLPPSSELHLPSLPLIITKRYSIKELEDGVQLTLSDMLEDRVCFREFFRYLQSGIVSENLRFIRALQVYKTHITSTDRVLYNQGVEWAWKIYKFFIAPYSAYEISVADKTRRDIMRQLADPDVGIFDPLERTTMNTLRVHFNIFRNRKEYAALNSVVLDTVEFQHEDNANVKSHSTAWGCFRLA